MAKPTLSTFKKYLATLSEPELRAELLELFKLPQVQEHYAKGMLSEGERKSMLDDVKRKIQNQFWTRTGNPRNVSNANIRKLISDFEKIAASPRDVVELLLFRVETATKFAHEFGGMPDADYNAALNAFDKAMKLMTKHALVNEFRVWCKEIFLYDNLDYWYIESMMESFEEHTGEQAR